MNTTDNAVVLYQALDGASCPEVRLDSILSVGYRVNSKKGTRFRIWATKVLKDHIVKGESD